MIPTPYTPAELADLQGRLRAGQTIEASPSRLLATIQALITASREALRELNACYACDGSGKVWEPCYKCVEGVTPHVCDPPDKCDDCQGTGKEPGGKGPAELRLLKLIGGDE